jgi:DNA-binding winged helix-turn-helix (wHTH) protein
MALAPVTPVVVRFGVFEADLSAGELRRDGVKLHLQELPLRTLAVLLDHPNEVVTHDQLRQALWADDVFVDFERSIRSAVKRLRDALGDSADNPIFIETVERHGYRWIGPPRSLGTAAVSETAVAASRTPAMPSPWWRLLYAVPALTVLAVFWLLLPVYRNSAKRSDPVASTNGVHNAANPEAEDFYLKGRFYWNKRTPESLTQAVDAFTQAIIHDPNYAPAYVGLADCYNLLREFTAMPAGEAYSPRLCGR